MTLSFVNLWRQCRTGTHVVRTWVTIVLSKLLRWTSIQNEDLLLWKQRQIHGLHYWALLIICCRLWYGRWKAWSKADMVHECMMLIWECRNMVLWGAVYVVIVLLRMIGICVAGVVWWHRYSFLVVLGCVYVGGGYTLTILSIHGNNFIPVFCSSEKHSPVEVTNILQLERWTVSGCKANRRSNKFSVSTKNGIERRRASSAWLNLLSVECVVIGGATYLRRKLVLHSVDIRCLRCSSSVFWDFRSPSQDSRLYASWVISFDNNYWGFSHWTSCTQTT